MGQNTERCDYLVISVMRNSELKISFDPHITYLEFLKSDKTPRNCCQHQQMKIE